MLIIKYIKSGRNKRERERELGEKERHKLCVCMCFSSKYLRLKPFSAAESSSSDQINHVFVGWFVCYICSVYIITSFFFKSQSRTISRLVVTFRTELRVWAT